MFWNATLINSKLQSVADILNFFWGGGESLMKAKTQGALLMNLYCIF